MATFNVQGALDAGYSQEEVDAYLKKNPALKPAPVPKSAQQQPAATPTPNQPSFLSRLGKNLVKAPGEMLGIAGQEIIGAAKGVGKTITGGQELFGKAADVVTNPITKLITGKEAPKYQTPAVVKKAITPNNDAQAFGMGAEQIAELFIPGGATTKVGKLVEGAKILKGSPKLLKSVLKLGAKAGTEGVGQGTVQAAQSGKIDKETGRAALYGGLGPVLDKTVGNIFQKGKQALYKSTIPTTILQSGKDLLKGLNIGEEVSKTGFSLTRGSLTKKLETVDKQIGAKIGAKIDAVVSKNPNETFSITDLTKDVKKNIFDDPSVLKKLKATPIDKVEVEKVVNDVVDQYNNLYQGKKMSYKDIQKLKVDLSIGLQQEFDKAVGASMKAKNAAEMQVRSAAQKLVEKGVPGAKKLNKELAPIKEALARLRKKGDYKGTLYDLLVGGFTAGGMDAAVSDPLEYGKNFIKGVALRRLATSVAAKTLGGSALKLGEKASSNAALLQILRKALSNQTEEKTEK